MADTNSLPIRYYARAGDRWYVNRRMVIKDDRKLILEPFWNLLLTQDQKIELEFSDGKQLSGKYCAKENAIVFEMIPKGVDRGLSNAIELLSLDPVCLKIIQSDTNPTISLEQSSNNQSSKDFEVKIDYSPEDYEFLKAPISSWENFQLSQYAIQYGSVPGFNNLISLPQLRDVDLYDHQIKAVKMVLQRMRGRAMLCDEVGLGKTIEAGIVLMELFTRKLVCRTLILTPPSLVQQWKGEMLRKFGLNFISNDDPDFKKEGLEA